MNGAKAHKVNFDSSSEGKDSSSSSSSDSAKSPPSWDECEPVEDDCLVQVNCILKLN